MPRTPWVLGNWKQNLLSADAKARAAAICTGLPKIRSVARGPHVRVGIAPTFVGLAACRVSTGPRHPDLLLAAQNVGAQESGAFTGEIGPQMLLDVGVSVVILGHSERRAHFGEDDAIVQKKIAAALAVGLTSVLCVGEPLDVREAGRHESHVITQLDASLAGIDLAAATDRIIIAYEPVWAIGTGRTATPAQANDMHSAIRSWLASRQPGTGRDRSILYGGSVKSGNAAELIAQPEVDGFLVGGASLVPSDFLSIIRAAAEAETS
ncbi:MAG: triose-phosphate isomerase [Nannocystaceae bacterium]